jgi:predicted nucleic acid-binding protein
VLVDTSVWIDHFRRRDAALVTALENAVVQCHPFVVGELACGHLRARSEILGLLQTLSMLPEVEHREALAFVELHQLSGEGIGWLDVHLLAATALAVTTLWTHDRRLGAVARRLGLDGDPRAQL